MWLRGGWAYQNFNDRYPDVDDTAMVVEALIKSPQADQPRVQASIDKGTKWILAMQNKDGGFPAWEKDTPSWMHKAFETQQGMDVLVDPSESDVTARVIRALVAYKNNRGSRNFVRDVNLDSAIFRSCRFLISKAQWQEGVPTWSGDWGVNYLYGTAEAVTSLLESGCWELEEALAAVQWIVQKQNGDGGWGESAESYVSHQYKSSRSRVMLTGFVLNGLMTFAEQAGSAYTPPSVRTAIARGIEYVTKVTLESNNPVLENDFGATLFKGLMYGRYVRLSQYEGLRVLGRYLDDSIKWE